MGTLIVAQCSEKAARFAVEHWHYSHSYPFGKSVRCGIWEDGRFIGAVVFARGANSNLGKKWGFGITEAVELARVAMTEHHAPVSQVVAQALAYLRRTNPGLRAVISFADPARGHHGGVYQAGNWIYTGASSPERRFVVHGLQLHRRIVYDRGWRDSEEWLRRHVDSQARVVKVPGKHRYIYPLDKATRRRLARCALPYPRAVEASTVTRPVSDREGRVQLPATAPTPTS